MGSKIVVAASSESTGRRLARALGFLRMDIDVQVGRVAPSSLRSCRLAVWEGDGDASPMPLMKKLPPAAQVVVIIPRLDLRTICEYMQDPRVTHFLASPADPDDLQQLVEKLATGAIFGLERYLGARADVNYRRLSTFEERTDVLDEIDAYVREHRLRGKLRRNASSMTEELLMNAMYQAPVDEDGHKLFAKVDPNVRIRRKTPQPVSLRYTVHRESFCVSVRDRFGSFTRADLVRCLRRCVVEGARVEQKKLGAGLGIYLIVSTASRLVINLLPGFVSEFICFLEPGSASSSLKMLSLTTQRPVVAVSDD